MSTAKLKRQVSWLSIKMLILINVILEPFGWCVYTSRYNQLWLKLTPDQYLAQLLCNHRKYIQGICFSINTRFSSYAPLCFEVYRRDYGRIGLSVDVAIPFLGMLTIGVAFANHNAPAHVTARCWGFRINRNCMALRWNRHILPSAENNLGFEWSYVWNQEPKDPKHCKRVQSQKHITIKIPETDGVHASTHKAVLSLVHKWDSCERRIADYWQLVLETPPVILSPEGCWTTADLIWRFGGDLTEDEVVQYFINTIKSQRQLKYTDTKKLVNFG